MASARMGVGPAKARASKLALAEKAAAEVENVLLPLRLHLDLQEGYHAAYHALSYRSRRIAGPRLRRPAGKLPAQPLSGAWLRL